MECFFAIEVKTTAGKEVIIKTNWKNSEVEVEIFQENSELLLKGRKKISDVEKQCKILSIDLTDVKKAFISHDPLIQFEINGSQKKVNMI